MTRIAAFLAERHWMARLALLTLAIVVAACKGAGGGSGY